MLNWPCEPNTCPCCAISPPPPLQYKTVERLLSVRLHRCVFFVWGSASCEGRPPIIARSGRVSRKGWGEDLLIYFIRICTPSSHFCSPIQQKLRRGSFETLAAACVDMRKWAKALERARQNCIGVNPRIAIFPTFWLCLSKVLLTRQLRLSAKLPTTALHSPDIHVHTWLTFGPVPFKRTLGPGRSGCPRSLF